MVDFIILDEPAFSALTLRDLHSKYNPKEGTISELERLQETLIDLDYSDIERKYKNWILYEREELFQKYKKETVDFINEEEFVYNLCEKAEKELQSKYEEKIRIFKENLVFPFIKELKDIIVLKKQEKLEELEKGKKPDFITCECGENVLRISLKDHKRTVKHFNKLNGIVKEEKPEIITCECGETIPRVMLKDHKRTKKHFNKLNGIEEKPEFITCECGETIPRVMLKDHKRTKKHFNKLNGIVKEEKPQFHHCEICNKDIVNTSNAVSYHNLSKPHMKNRIESLESEFNQYNYDELCSLFSDFSRVIPKNKYISDLLQTDFSDSEIKRIDFIITTSNVYEFETAIHSYEFTNKYNSVKIHIDTYGIILNKY